MHLTTLSSCVLAALSALSSTATAAAIGEPAVPPTLKVLSVRAIGNDTLTWYGSTSPSVDSPPTPELLRARQSNVGCGTLSIQCGPKHAYSGYVCDQLIAAVSGDLQRLVASPRAVCYGQNDGVTAQCCISWSKEADNTATYRDLVASAQRTRTQCGTTGTSGQEWNVKIGYTCISQCLSNRADGCT